jgi:hypothetical protein
MDYGTVRSTQEHALLSFGQPFERHKASDEIIKTSEFHHGRVNARSAFGSEVSHTHLINYRPALSVVVCLTVR